MATETIDDDQGDVDNEMSYAVWLLWFDIFRLIMYDVFVTDLTFSFDSFRNIGQLLIEIFLNVNNWARKIICFECVTTWCWLIRSICMDLLLRHFYHPLPYHRVPVPEPKLPTVS